MKTITLLTALFICGFAFNEEANPNAESRIEIMAAKIAECESMPLDYVDDCYGILGISVVDKDFEEAYKLYESNDYYIYYIDLE